MEVRNIQSLLEQYLNDGFTFECLSIIADVPVELINRCYNRENLSQEDGHLLNSVLYILTQLYFCDTTEKTYIGDLVDAMCSLFKVSQSAVAKYLGLGNDEFIKFLDEPEKYPNGYNLSIKLLHLFKTITIDKKYTA